MPAITDLTINPLDLDAAVRRLEDALGLTRPRLDAMTRTLRIAEAAEVSGVNRWRGSLAADRIGTADLLLRRREEALLAGWDGITPMTPALAELATLGSVLAQRGLADLDTGADRLRHIQEALDADLRPQMTVRMYDDPSLLPHRWQQVLTRLHGIAIPNPNIRGCGMLRHFQAGLATANTAVISDDSLALAHASSRPAAAQAVAALLIAADSSVRASTAVVCADAVLTGLLDDRLHHCGLPRLGAPAAGMATALDGLLPLALALCWEPVEPQLLLEFCLLADGPLGRRVGTRLASALGTFPGLGSRTWRATIADLTAGPNDPEGITSARLARWFNHARVPIGTRAPASLLAERCRTVAQWAASRAAIVTLNTDDATASLVAGTAARLGEALSTLGGDRAWPEVARLLEEALLASAQGRHAAERNGSLLVNDIGLLPENIERVIWLAPTTVNAHPSAWTGAELSALAETGLTLDDDIQRGARLRRVRQRAVCGIATALLVIEVDANTSTRHPLVIGLRQAFERGGVDLHQTPCLDDLPAETLSGWHIPTKKTAISPPQGERVMWFCDPSLLRDRDRHSYSELGRRLACPLAWTLTYAAGLRRGGSVTLPAEHTLSGSFAHAVLEEVFENGLMEPDAAAAAAGNIFDRNVAVDAVPLALPGRENVRERLRDRVTEAARTIAAALLQAGCNTVQMEVPLTGTWNSHDLIGKIDCLGTGQNLAVILDIKLGSLKEREADLAAGRALQLAVYAATRSESTVAVGYYIINGRCLLTPQGSAIPATAVPGIRVVTDAPAAKMVWHAFEHALAANDAWYADGRVPARPLQQREERGPGCDVVLPPDADEPPCCTYCDFTTLCGRTRKH